MNDLPSGVPDETNPLVQTPHGSHPTSAHPTSAHTIGPPLGVKPTGVIVIGVISLLAGVPGLFSSVLTIVQLVFGEQISGMFVPSGPEGAAQRSMNAAIAAINVKYMIPHAISSLGSFTIAACLTIGGIGCLAKKPWTPSWMRKTLLAVVVLEVFRMFFFAVLQFETMPIMQAHMEKVFLSTSKGGGPSPEMMQRMQHMGMIIMYLFWGLWFFVKCGLAFWGRFYLKRPHVIAYFASQSSTA